MTKAKDFEILKVHIFSNAMKVIKVIKEEEDWAIKNLVEDILDFSWLFKKFDFSLIPRKLNWADVMSLNTILREEKVLGELKCCCRGLSLVFFFFNEILFLIKLVEKNVYT